MLDNVGLEGCSNQYKVTHLNSNLRSYLSDIAFRGCSNRYKVTHLGSNLRSYLSDIAFGRITTLKFESQVTHSNGTKYRLISNLSQSLSVALKFESLWFKDVSRFVCITQI